MLGRSVFTRASTKAVNKVRHNSSYNEIPRMLMQNVWRKSTGLYVTYLVAGCVVVETIYGGFTNTLWNVTNRGKTYETVDWSKFVMEEDDDDEDEDDE